MKLIIRNEAIRQLNETENVGISFPKYTSQLVNWANQNAQGTRPKMVGQLSELFPEFQSETDKVTLENWKSWYLKKIPTRNSGSNGSDFCAS